MALVDELKKTANKVAANTLPVTQNALNTAAQDAQGRFNKGDYAGAAGRVVRGALETAGSIPLDAYEYGRQAVEAVAPAAGRFMSGLAGAAFNNPAQAAQTPQPATPNPAPDTYRDEAERGAAKTALSALANSSAAGGQNFADWQQGASQMQRDTAADAYRDAWQARAPQGMRGADANALALYNAEQTTRGTGITAQRGKNGVMEFSGDGANALPQSFTQGVDLQLANERNARANAIREQYLNENQGTKGLGLRNPVEDTNAQFRASREREALKNMGRDEMNAFVRMREADMQRDKSNAELALRGQEMEGANAYRQGSLAQQAAQTDVQRQRLGIDQQEVGARALTAGLQGEMTRSQLAEQQRIGKLRDAYMAETDPSKKEQMGRALLTLQGKEPRQERDEETKARYGLISELAKSYGTMPPMGPDGKPIPFEQYAEPALRMAGGNRGGNSQQAPSYEQYAAQMKARNPGADDKTISQEYMKRYGG